MIESALKVLSLVGKVDIEYNADHRSVYIYLQLWNRCYPMEIDPPTVLAPGITVDTDGGTLLGVKIDLPAQGNS